MELVLTRIAKRKGYTIGRLSIENTQPSATPTAPEGASDGVSAGTIVFPSGDERGACTGTVCGAYFCDTLEPTALELKTTVSKEAVLRSPKKAASLKPFAIPEGRYAVVISWSPKMKKWLPILLGVPMFSGIRIHAGNTARDTAGCILVGQNLKKGMVLNSNIWLHRLKQKIVEAKDRDEAVWITIR